MESFSQRLQQCTRKKDDELTEEKAQLGIAESKEDEEDDEVTKLNKGTIPAQPGRYAKGSQEFMAATAAQTLAIYVSLLPEARQSTLWQRKSATAPSALKASKASPGTLTDLALPILFYCINSVFFKVIEYWIFHVDFSSLGKTASLSTLTLTSHRKLTLVQTIDLLL